MNLSDNTIKRYQEIIPLFNEWEVETPTGWTPLNHIMRTIPYEVWRITFTDRNHIEGADTHILIDAEGREVFLKDCKPGDSIRSRNGVSTVSFVDQLLFLQEMFDLDLNDTDHVFWTNDVLSHNCVLSDTMVTIQTED